MRFDLHKLIDIIREKSTNRVVAISLVALLLVIGMSLKVNQGANQLENALNRGGEQVTEDGIVAGVMAFEYELSYGQKLDFYENMDSYKVDAVALQIDHDRIYLKDVETAKGILEDAQEMMLKKEHNVDINISLEENKIKDIEFEVAADVICETVLKEINILEDIEFVPVRVFENQILDREDAIDYVTKINEEPEIYKIAKGDVPSIIAQNNDMSLKDLYELNPGLEGKSTKIQIGDPVVITVPKPELTIETSETVVYTESIPKAVVKENTEKYYRGTSKTIKPGSNGEKEITATVKKVNGVESERIIEVEKVLVEPVSQLVAVGTKLLPAKGAKGSFVSPLSSYRVSSSFGPRWNDFHKGVDLAAPMGSSVRASDGGIVTYSGWLGTYGYLVVIDHGNGFKTKYAHNSKLLVKVNQYVAQYEEIAKVGSTGNSSGPHVHLEILVDGQVVNPMSYIE